MLLFVLTKFKLHKALTEEISTRYAATNYLVQIRIPHRLRLRNASKRTTRHEMIADYHCLTSQGYLFLKDATLATDLLMSLENCTGRIGGP